MYTCSWAPSIFAGTKLVRGDRPQMDTPTGELLTNIVSGYVQRVEKLGLTHILIAQRWWGNAEEIEGSTLDCLAMTGFIAAHSTSLNLITAIHPGFFEPAQIAKWGATIDNITGGRWGINVTSGWNLEEFSMYGVDALSHDERYERSSEFIDLLKSAWSTAAFSHKGKFYEVENLIMEPRPVGDLEVFQGGQSDAAIEMACRQSDWMFLNGGSLEKISGIIGKVRAKGEEVGRCPRFAVYGIPLCRESDDEANDVIAGMIDKLDPALLEARRDRVSGAEGMWSEADKITMLDTNEGYATGLIGSPEKIVEQAKALKAAGVDMLHLMLGDELFETEALPMIHRL